MNLLRAFLLAAAISLFAREISLASEAAPVETRIRVLVISGGHDFEKEPFFALFKNNPEITYRAAEHPQAQPLLQAESASQFDVLVLYDYYQIIPEETRANFLAWLKAGKGLVVMHHAIASYQEWPEYAKIIGAKYYLKKTEVAGVEKPRSVFKHGVNLKVHVADPAHPVTRGLKDFEIHDETYRLYDVDPGVHPLLTTDSPESNHLVAWAKEYENSRVVYIQGGHDHFAYENPSYQQLLRQAIRWTSPR